jgi:hypothetical protein
LILIGSQHLPGASAQFCQQLAVEQKIDPHSFGDTEGYRGRIWEEGYRGQAPKKDIGYRGQAPNDNFPKYPSHNIIMAILFSG